MSEQRIKEQADRCLEEIVHELRSALERERANSAVLRDDMQIVLLPMAKGYAAEHDVGNNRRMIANVEARLAASNPGAGVMEVVRAMKALLPVAKMLYANADGCAVNHYGEDYRKHGQPGWLADALVTITESDKALAALNGGRDA